jgi:Uma2 family endonuclease
MELDIPMKSGGSTTFRRREMRRGLEPDECYWIHNEPAVRGKRQHDFRHDPPPDLAIEVEISRSALDRPSIYASLRVPEIWRLVRGTVQVNLLQEDGQYAVSETSRAFPFLPVGQLSRFLEIDETTDETTWLRTFVQWVRAQNFRR